ncbi:hypothetical protein SAMN02745225_01942 [Ferrithrix thermotolerans DSM 19514]|jgi:hypothetical protein|uniref:Uncharacterized protein n=1 Tax=Ferrithrix thermotolerans DSM 19514 TaxID=1121881 RepID=A0A1M4X8Y3_9ACTN|nr:hypothetical protein [Ferrithrix thermotolerans]SHE89865.1 hypothetical protein SAMN02745225_01942 [Ferrithrix thermotolerans DSM 19514]
MSQVQEPQRSCPVDFGKVAPSAADVAVCKLLRVSKVQATASSEEKAQRLFSVAMVISGLRCILSYVILPFVLPALGLGVTAGVGPLIGIPVGLVALAFDVRGVRRFWIAGHKWRWQMTAIYTSVMALVTYLVIGDFIQLLR